MRISSIFRRKQPDFTLENVIETNRNNPRTFLIPSQKEIQNLHTGQLVKLIFVMNSPQKNSCRAERMWVKITTIQNRLFTGILDSLPCYIKTIKNGDCITFQAENIAAVYGGKVPFDEKLFAIITKKAYEKRQINWVVRTDDKNNEQDSGWQLFYGDESEQYLDNAENSTIISLENVLSFEPLLETVFGGAGYFYEYSVSENRFIEVKG